MKSKVQPYSTEYRQAETTPSTDTIRYITKVYQDVAIKIHYSIYHTHHRNWQDCQYNINLNAEV